MDRQSSAAVAAPELDVAKAPRKRQQRKPKRQPRYHVILWDDNDHSYDYVIRMMQELFGHSYERGYQIACDVDSQGRATCLTTTREHAELKRDQIHSYGKDRLIAHCAGSMSSSIEPEA
jgi:ATP-dependent Clp protease adaptor protein ClpS